MKAKMVYIFNLTIELTEYEDILPLLYFLLRLKYVINKLAL